MGYEIDFLAVGTESKGGDAIALRYGDLHKPRTAQTVVVIDGGYKDSGTALVDLIRNRYGTEVVDIVISTHPDQDHISGLEVVVEELIVGQLWMHQPWRHNAAMNQARSSAFTTLGTSDYLTKSLQDSSDLETIATRRGIPIVEPFTGLTAPGGGLRILGPSVEYYEELLPSMYELSSASSSGSALERIVGSVLTKTERVLGRLLEETLDIETLRDDGGTRPSNNSSAITLLDVSGHKSLFTGDAGIPALERVVEVLEAEGFVPGDLRLAQVPHHGSRRNVGPAVLDRLLGKKGQPTQGHAVVSAPAKNPECKHPAKKVTNAFHRRGYEVTATQGKALMASLDGQPRADYSGVEPLPFYSQVEDDSES